MKKLPFLMMLAAGCFATSCDDNDNDSNNNNNNADFVGTYRMTSWNVPTANDYNNDGVKSTDLMTESDCYNNSEMVVNADGTYNMIYNSSEITAGGISGCRQALSSGSWKRSGNTITTTSIENGTTTNSDYDYVSSGHTMTRTMRNSQYPSYNSTNGSYEYSSGDVNYVFTRQ